MAEVIKNKIQLKRGPGAPSKGLLDVGEPGYDSTNKRLYIGNGLDVDATAIPNEAYVSQKIAEAAQSGSGVDLSAYATKEYVDDEIGKIDFPVDSVNGKTGVVSLGAEDIGARPNTWTPTAADVGARPDDWMPTASQVGAAPGGYGLGGGSTAKGVESITANGWYITNVNTPDSNYWLCQTFVTNNGKDITVEAWNLNGTVKMKRTKRSGTWGAWEAMIPSMSLNAEIRTTERYNGKVVYAKLVDFGALPNNANKNVGYRSNGSTGVVSITGMISDGCCISAGYNRDMSRATSAGLYLDNTLYNIRIRTEYDLSGYTAKILVKYTID